MTDYDKLRDGSRNRQLRLLFECWPITLNALIMIPFFIMILLLPLIQVVRAFFGGF